MRETATLRLPDGRELPVELDTDDLDQEEVVVHLAERSRSQAGSFLDIIDAHLSTAEPHPPGTTDRYREEDRTRPY